MSKAKSLNIEIDDLRAQVKKAQKDKDTVTKKQFRVRIHEILSAQVKHDIQTLEEPQNQTDLKKDTAADLLKKLREAYRKDEDFKFALESLEAIKTILSKDTATFAQLIKKVNKEIENCQDEKKQFDFDQEEPAPEYNKEDW